MSLKTRNIKAVLAPEGHPAHADQTFHVEIEDEGGGEFISICQPPDFVKLNINPEEWPALKKLVDKMFKQCIG